jgi:hypothetical protein
LGKSNGFVAKTSGELLEMVTIDCITAARVFINKRDSRFKPYSFGV